MEHTLPRRVHEAIRLISRSKFPEVVAVTLSVVMTGIGTSLVLVPERYRTPTFLPAWHFASPLAWAAAMILVGLTSILIVTARREWAPAPMIAQTCIWGIWSALTGISVASPPGGVPSAPFVYTGCTWLALLLSTLYIIENTDAREGTR